MEDAMWSLTVGSLWALRLGVRRKVAKEEKNDSKFEAKVGIQQIYRPKKKAYI